MRSRPAHLLSADLTTHHHGHVAAPAARAAPAINDVPLLTGCDLYSAQEVTHAVGDLGVAAGILRRRAEDIRAGVAVAPIGPAPPPRQSRSRSPSRRRGFQFWLVRRSLISIVFFFFLIR